jgi:hypothetical protein
MKSTISDTLAWVAFAALLLWITAVLLTLTSYWQVWSDVMAIIDEVKACASNQCESQFFLERLSSTTTAFGFNTDQVKSVRMPAFTTWFVIALFQSFYVRSFRIWPWLPVGERQGNPSKPTATMSSPARGPIKVLTLLKRKAGLSTEEFRDHYENVHRHLGEKYLAPHAVRYFRRYVEPGSGSPGYATAPDFDVIMEVWFPDQRAMASAMEAINSPAAQAELKPDEERLFDRTATKSFIVEEISS